jgi:hypothetical protein
VVGLRACPPCNTNTIDRTLAASLGQRSSIQGAGSVTSFAPPGSVLQNPGWIVTRKVTALLVSKRVGGSEARWATLAERDQLLTDELGEGLVE